MAFRLSYHIPLLLLLAAGVQAQDLRINEIMASNTRTYADEAHEYDDWVEIYNAGSQPVNLARLYVTDDLSDPTKLHIPAGHDRQTTIQPGDYLILWFDDQPEQGPLHLPAKLSASGEEVALMSSDGSTIIDHVAFGPQNADMSFGRGPRSDQRFTLFEKPTPGSANVTAGIGLEVDRPRAQPAGGQHAGGLAARLSSPDQDAQIHYTLDGSVPTTASPQYVRPIPIFETSVLRARAFVEGRLPSRVLSETYLIDVPHDLPIVTLVTDPANLWDETSGIYVRGPDTALAWPFKDANFWRDWERDVHMSFYEPDGRLGFQFDAGMKIAGGSSRSAPQKSLDIFLRARYGKTMLEYPVFPGDGVKTFRRLRIRNSGNDVQKTMLQDAFMQGLVLDMSDVPEVRPVKANGQRYRPVVLYINGVYWGVQNIREKLNEDYVHYRSGENPEDVEIISHYVSEVLGDSDNYRLLMEFLEANSLDVKSSYRVISNWIDVEEAIDYYATQIYYANGDWPRNNYKMYRERRPGARWHWLLFDTDFGFGGSRNASYDAIDAALNTRGFSTLIFRRLMENPGFRNDFFNRYNDLINTAWQAPRADRRLEEMAAVIESEMERHWKRWDVLSVQGWKYHLAKLPRFAADRPDQTRAHFEALFDEITGSANVTLSQTEGGTVKINSVSPDLRTQAWSGVYFTGVPIALTAVPADGYRFAGWSDPSLPTDAIVEYALTGDLEVTALFEPAAHAPPPIVITELNYHSPEAADAGDWVEIFNMSEEPVSLGGWRLRDKEGVGFEIPAWVSLDAGTYLVLAEDVNRFRRVHSEIPNVIGDLEFKLSNGGERVQLVTPTGLIVDAVEYDDEDPWPVEADGHGPTIELPDVHADNSRPASWVASPDKSGSPGTGPLDKNAHCKLVSLDSRVEGDELVVTWTTAEEITLSGFAVEHLAPAPSAYFREVAFVESVAPPGGGSTYELRLSGFEAGRQQFRLRRDRMDGASIYLRSFEATFGFASPLVLEAVWPNPADTRAHVRFAAEEASELSLTLHDATGRVVRQVYRSVAGAGRWEVVDIDTEGLAAGVYLLRLAGRDEVRTRSLVVVR